MIEVYIYTKGLLDSQDTTGIDIDQSIEDYYELVSTNLVNFFDGNIRVYHNYTDDNTESFRILDYGNENIDKISNSIRDILDRAWDSMEQWISYD